MYAGELTYHLPLHECISHIYPYSWFVLFYPFVDDWQKGGEWFWVYICIFRNWVYACSMFIKRKGEGFWKFIQHGGEGFQEEDFLVYACFSHLIYAYIFV